MRFGMRLEQGSWRKFQLPALAERRLRYRCYLRRSRSSDLLVNPAVGLLETLTQRTRRRPSELLANQPIIGVPTPHTQRPRNMLDPQLFPCDRHYHCGQLVNSDHFLGADIHRFGEVRLHQPPNAFDALIDVEE